jgi:tetratricopeptide (TPR) repeat protein
VQLRPLQGRAYIQLAELSFLKGNDAAAKHAYIDQALAVRPHDGAVLFAAGSEAIMVGQFDTGIEYWRRAFRSGPEYQATIIQNIAARVPPDFFLASFQPDLQGLRLLYNHYRRSEMREAVEYLGPMLAEQLEKEASALADRRAGALWYEAHLVEREIGRTEAALHSGRQAVLLDGSDYEKRRAVARWLCSQGLYAEAAIHLRWCLHRRPDDTSLLELLRQAVKSTNGPVATRVSQAPSAPEASTRQRETAVTN